jgi:predicted ATP-binding protein involved in virulence
MHMRISKVKIQNYRGIKEIEIGFDPGFNLLVGVNGSGKSSMLMALAASFYGTAVYLSLPSVPSPMEDEDVRLERLSFDGLLRFERQYPSRITSSYIYNETPFTWSVSKDSAATRPTIKGDTIGAYLHTKLQDEKLQKNLSFPLFAFYRASRHWSKGSQNELISVIETVARTAGYASYDNASVDGPGMQRWLIAKSMERYQTSSETGRHFEDIDNDELALVNSALTRAVSEMKGVRFDVRERSIMVDWTDSGLEQRAPTPFANLSDGQRAIIGLVVDIARRMCLLNPQLGMQVINASEGVILIDEIDMHLHPKWQRNLITGLQQAFPAIQFIVASHSPQVIGELRPEQIIVLSAGMTAHPKVSYGLDSSSVLEEIMGADKRTLQVQSDLDRLFLALERDELGEAKRALQSLKESAPGISDLNKAEALLRRKEILGR